MMMMMMMMMMKSKICLYCSMARAGNNVTSSKNRGKSGRGMWHPMRHLKDSPILEGRWLLIVSLHSHFFRLKQFFIYVFPYFQKDSENKIFYLKNTTENLQLRFIIHHQSYFFIYCLHLILLFSVLSTLTFTQTGNVSLTANQTLISKINCFFRFTNKSKLLLKTNSLIFPWNIFILFGILKLYLIYVCYRY